MPKKKSTEIKDNTAWKVNYSFQVFYTKTQSQLKCFTLNPADVNAVFKRECQNLDEKCNKTGMQSPSLLYLSTKMLRMYKGFVKKNSPPKSKNHYTHTKYYVKLILLFPFEKFRMLVEKELIN